MHYVGIECLGGDRAKGIEANVKRWIDAIWARPAAVRGREVGKEWRRQGGMSDAEKKVLFGQRAG